MQEVYICHNCGARIAQGSRFCSNCGVALDWRKQHIMSAPALPYGWQYAGGQQGWSQQPVQNQTSFDNQSGDSAVKPVRSEIRELLAELLDKPAKNN